MIEKFREGMLLHNLSTKEHGLVQQVYQVNEHTMYKVWVPVEPGTWVSGHHVSDWAEKCLELSDNAELKSKPAWKEC